MRAQHLHLRERFQDPLVHDARWRLTRHVELECRSAEQQMSSLHIFAVAIDRSVTYGAPFSFIGGMTWPGTGDTVPLVGGGDLCPEPLGAIVLIITIALVGPFDSEGPLLFGAGFEGIVTDGGMELLLGSRGIPVGLEPAAELACDPDELPKIAKVS